MDFFASKESLTIIEWILRGAVGFVFLLLAAKLMGQRSISQLRFIDFVIALSLGNIIAHPLSDPRVGFKGSMITTLVLVLLYVAATWLSLNWPLFKRFLNPPPIPLIKNGSIQFHNLSKAKISVEFLFSELRKEKVEGLQQVALAIWEPGGIISVFLDAPFQPVTPADLKLKTPPVTISRPIIIDGKIDMSLLQELGEDLDWLKSKIAPTHAHIRNVILATVTENGDVRVY